MLDMTRKTLEALEQNAAWTLDEVCERLHARGADERMMIVLDLDWLGLAGYASRTEADRWFMTDLGARTVGR